MDAFTREELEVIADKLLPREDDFIPHNNSWRGIYQKVMRLIDRIDANREYDRRRGISVEVDMDRSKD